MYFQVKAAERGKAPKKKNSSLNSISDSSLWGPRDHRGNMQLEERKSRLGIATTSALGNYGSWTWNLKNPPLSTACLFL